MINYFNTCKNIAVELKISNYYINFCLLKWLLFKDIFPEIDKSQKKEYYLLKHGRYIKTIFHLYGIIFTSMPHFSITAYFPHFYYCK